MTYSALFTALAPSNKRNKLNSYYKRITKCLYHKSRSYSWTQLCTECKIPNFNEIIYLEKCIYTFKINKCYLPDVILNEFSFSQHSKNILLKHHLIKSKSLHNTLAETWNTLHIDSKSVATVKGLKRSILPNLFKNNHKMENQN